MNKNLTYVHSKHVPPLKLISCGEFIGHIRISPETNIQQTKVNGVDFIFIHATLHQRQLDSGTIGLYAIRVDGAIGR